MAGFDPFIPLVKQIVNKVRRGDSGLTIPDWYQPQAVARPTGKFNPGAAEEKQVKKGQKWEFNPGKAETLKVEIGQSMPFNPAAATPLSSPSDAVEDPHPYGAYYFALEITGPDNKKGVEVAHFRECSGLKNSCTPYEIEEGGVNYKSYKRPGQAKWENIQLKYATSASTFLLAWRDAWLMGTDNWKDRTKYSGAITLMDNNGNAIKRYEFKDAWPVSWEGPALNSGSSDLAVETLEIAHHGIEVVDPDHPTGTSRPAEWRG